MEPITYTDYHNELNSLSYSPILGNKQISKTNISQIPKPSFTREKVESLSATSAARALSPKPRKRLYSQTNLSPSDLEKDKKMTKNDDELKALIIGLKADIANSKEELGGKIDNNHDILTGQIAELRTRQEEETKKREDMENEFTVLREEFKEINIKIDNATAPTADAVAEAMAPLVEAAVEKHMKAKESQINATYYQSLVNDLKNHEKDLMIYGLKLDGGPNIENEIRQKLFKDKLNMDIGSFKAVQIGTETGGKPRPIRVSLQSNEIRDSITRQANKLPRGGGVSVEKCLPQRYRQPHREYRRDAWQLKEAADVQTRVVFKAHKLVLQFKQHDEISEEGTIKYDWSIAKEYFPQPESPTDRGEATRNRLGLKPSKTIEQIGTSKVIMSNLNITGDNVATKEYFDKAFIKPEDIDKIVEVNVEKASAKKLLIVTLHSKEDCLKFKTTYENKKFNGELPRVSVMFER